MKRSWMLVGFNADNPRHSSGYSPAELRGERVGVFVGCSVSETAMTLVNELEDDATVGYLMAGTARSMFANR